MDPSIVQFNEVLQLPWHAERTRRLFGLFVVLGALALVIVATLRLWHDEVREPGALLTPLLFGTLVVLYGFWVVRAQQETTLKGGLLQVRRRLNSRLWPTGRVIDVRRIRALSVVPCVPTVDGPWTGQCGQAVRILLEDGDDIRLGSERPEELLAALETARARLRPPPA